MPTAETEIETLANREYKWGFVTDIEADDGAAGPERGDRPLHQPKKDEPQWMLDWRLKAYRHWLTMEEPHDWPQAQLSADRLPGDDLLLGPKAEAEEPGRSRSGTAGDLRQARHPAARAGRAARRRSDGTDVAVDAVFDSVSVATTFKKKLGEMGIIFCSFGEAVQKHPELVKKYSARSCPTPTTSTRR